MEIIVYNYVHRNLLQDTFEYSNLLSAIEIVINYFLFFFLFSISNVLGSFMWYLEYLHEEIQWFNSGCQEHSRV